MATSTHTCMRRWGKTHWKETQRPFLSAAPASPIGRKWDTNSEELNSFCLSLSLHLEPSGSPPSVERCQVAMWSVPPNTLNLGEREGGRDSTNEDYGRKIIGIRGQGVAQTFNKWSHQSEWWVDSQELDSLALCSNWKMRLFDFLRISLIPQARKLTMVTGIQRSAFLWIQFAWHKLQSNCMSH